jgi:hypothetical protein
MLTDVLRAFSQFVQTKARIEPRLGDERFLPNPFRFIVHQSRYHTMLYSSDTDSILK